MDVEELLQRAFEFLAAGVNLVVEGGGGDTGMLGDRQPRRIGTVRGNERDLGREIRRAPRLDERAHVRAAAGNQDRSATTRAHSARCPDVVTRGPAPASPISPIRIGASPACDKADATSSAAARAATAIMPMPQLRA